MTTFDASLTKADIARILEFQARLKEDNELHFSSDLFRAYNLHRYYEHPDKEIGMLFAKLKIHGLAVPFGELASEIPSNHKRKNDLWMWTEKGKNIQKAMIA